MNFPANYNGLIHCADLSSWFDTPKHNCLISWCDTGESLEVGTTNFGEVLEPTQLRLSWEPVGTIFTRGNHGKPFLWMERNRRKPQLGWKKPYKYRDKSRLSTGAIFSLAHPQYGLEHPIFLDTLKST